ncbi:MAG: N-acetylmuramoyl-L-alanine amidase [Bacilli bacterium]
MKKVKKPIKYKRLRIILIPLFLISIGILISIIIHKPPLIKESLSYKEDLSKTSHEVSKMTFIKDGVKIKVNVSSPSQSYSFKICKLGSSTCSISESTVLNGNSVEGAILLSNLENGSYELFLDGDNSEKLTDTKEQIERLNRAHLGDKLITFNYSNNRVKLLVEDFKYEYDVLIDPGHGGRDSGSDNGEKLEKNLNLELSLYEKKRYQDHGLKVKLIRENDSYGIKMGDPKWSLVRQRSYAIGYYGTVSKIIYSNHHNWSASKTYSGWEIIVPGRIANDNLKVEKSIAKVWKEIYPVREKHIRFYATKAPDGGNYSRLDNQIYTFTDYYSVIRTPYDLFNVKNILYEASYINCKKDYEWYYKKGNWKKLSEVKIKNYVESLGIKYLEVS